MKHLLAINGSYREHGIIDQAVEVAAQAAREAGAAVEIVHLRDFPIEFCRNCRECTQTPGEEPGTCVQKDRLQELVDKIEASDGLILASPTNFYSVTALFKRFMERLIVYAYWPWGTPAPVMRKQRIEKKAILIASCAAPGLLGRFVYTTLKQLKLTAKTVGAKPVGSAFIGLIAQQERTALSDKEKGRVRRLMQKLI